ncbi:killer cell lectin-like receptor subfamily B member 1B allele C isoform X3 [Mauremys reevesii]|uniref:killer cell lectin-like receptor subfamily B member 1B allele C isoform X3 n=1 Tax=Mauremys reevesii TaxID=260615 RepID=UPI00193FD8B4|nr:killer cell lectin-like receptor subfamily B member 1B allele C isoform X3 [Mauremys reevesii]
MEGGCAAGEQELERHCQVPGGNLAEQQAAPRTQPGALISCTMAGEIVYADLHLASGFPSSRMPLSAQPLSPPSPRWHRTALWVGWIGNIVLVIAVIALGIWVSEKRQTPAAPDCAGAGSRDTSTAECSAHLERFRSQLTQRLCHPAQPGPAGGSGCKLCPTDWQLRGDKCYWVSRRGKMWSESRADCSARGSQLLVIRDREELEFLKDLTQSSNQFWVGLSVPSPEKVWTWLDGSRLDQTQLPVSDPADGSSCGVVKGNQIHSDICGSVLQWICQRDPVPL